jgi:hypothetical protein
MQAKKTVGLGENNWRQIDVSVENHGSIVVLRPLSSAAKEWMKEYVDQTGFQPYRDSVIVEPRYADAILDGMKEQGLHVEL